MWSGMSRRLFDVGEDLPVRHITEHSDHMQHGIAGGFLDGSAEECRSLHNAGDSGDGAGAGGATITGWRLACQPHLYRIKVAHNPRHLPHLRGMQLDHQHENITTLQSSFIHGPSRPCPLHVTAFSGSLSQSDSDHLPGAAGPRLLAAQ
eukprot:755379-Hanusia_phi.AAC.1